MTTLQTDQTQQAVKGVEQTYFEFLEQGVWHVPRCSDCDRAVFYPRQLCPHCGGTDFLWFQPSGRGVIYSTTTVRRGPQAGGDYNISLIDVDDGFRMMSVIADVAPDQPRIGDKVRAELRRHGEANRVVFCLETQA